jgi:hypothetical protein
MGCQTYVRRLGVSASRVALLTAVAKWEA